MEFSAGQIADLLQGKVIGNADVKVNTVSKIEEGKPGSLAFLANPKYTKYIYDTKADIVLVNKDFIPEKKISATLIKVDDAYKAFASLLEIYQQYKNNKTGISESAFMEKTATAGKNTYIGAGVYIGEHTHIADNCKIYPNTYIGDNVKIGEGTVIFSGVNIYSETVIGENCILHSGVVVGSDGFGFAPQNSAEFKKIPQIGNVIIEDRAEIGANTSIDRATIGSTVIRKGVKLDNLVQIAHNVEIGENTVIASQTGVSGSTKIGKNCMIGGQVGFAGHLTIGDNVRIGAQSGVHKDLPDNVIVQGTPVTGYREWYRIAAVLQKLPEIYRKIQKI
ncbi:MAG: UDP-3-O-(3-hydroxymyristoyl)glucosamine N-acyltransferase [Chlorobi bacterium]|nr:UDP-3-O-(3-hydroxymyristoyl)glucosamine N-acyltransferase [Chlorobiota bacterium]